MQWRTIWRDCARQGRRSSPPGERGPNEGRDREWCGGCPASVAAGSFLGRYAPSMPIRRIIALVALLLLGAIGALVAWLWLRFPHEAPPRATDRIVVPPQRSVIAVPISAPLSGLGKALEAAVPRALWTIDQPGQGCGPSSKVKVLFAHIKTPTIKCRIVGRVTRGALTLSGRGQTIQIS